MRSSISATATPARWTKSSPADVRQVGRKDRDPHVVAVAIGLLVLMSQNPTNPSAVTLIGLTCIGLGVGIGQPVALQTSVGAFDPAQRGVGSGFVNSIRLVANAAGAAIAGGVLTLTMADSEPSEVSNSLVKGASSCGMSRSTDNLIGASDLCTAYVDGVKIVLQFSLALVFAALLAVSIWSLIPRQGRTGSVSVGKVQEGEGKTWQKR